MIQNMTTAKKYNNYKVLFRNFYISAKMGLSYLSLSLFEVLLNCIFKIKFLLSLQSFLFV